LKRVRQTDVDIVEHGQFAGAQKDALLRVAELFDRREFLPSPTDVREFMYLIGERPNSIKDRSDAFRLLLKHFSQLTAERLDHISRNAIHSGPSQLAPLSEAIANVGSSRIKSRYTE